jgi:hypothetical protein
VGANITPGFGDDVSSQLFSHFSTYYLTDQAQNSHLSVILPPFPIRFPPIDRSIDQYNIDQMNASAAIKSSPCQVSTNSPMLVQLQLLLVH